MLYYYFTKKDPQNTLSTVKLTVSFDHPTAYLCA